MFDKLIPSRKKYKFRALKSYSDIKWLSDNQKNYRSVFDRYEVDYIYAEFSFYNKLFDTKDWTLECTLKCFSQEEDNDSQLICELPFKKVIKAHQNIFHLREGWGHKDKGIFWKPGTYCWSIEVEGKEIGEHFFHITESPKNYPSPSHYVKFQSLTLFEGDGVNTPPDAKSLCKFCSSKTRYIHHKLTLHNNLPDREWFCEITMRHYDQSRNHFSNHQIIHRVEKGAKILDMTLFWGADDYGSWSADNYSVELIFLDTLLAIGHFTVGNEIKIGPIKTSVHSLFRAVGENNAQDTNLNAHILRSQKERWIRQIAEIHIQSVLEELLSFSHDRYLNELTKQIVHVSTQWHRLQKKEVVTPHDYEQFSNTLVDLIQNI